MVDFSVLASIMNNLGFGQLDFGFGREPRKTNQPRNESNPAKGEDEGSSLFRKVTKQLNDLEANLEKSSRSATMAL